MTLQPGAAPALEARVRELEEENARFKEALIYISNTEAHDLDATERFTALMEAIGAARAALLPAKNG
jgi:hypothetical protein